MSPCDLRLRSSPIPTLPPCCSTSRTMPRSPRSWRASACASSSGRPAQPVARRPPDAVMAAYRADIDRLVRRARLPAPSTSSASRPTTPTARRCAGSSSTSTSTRRTRCASSSPARACSPCTSATRSTRCCASAGDLIGVPDGTRHWFDMGPEPSFVAIRFFTEPDGWVGHFTGTDIAQRFPRFDERRTRPDRDEPHGDQSSPTSKAPPAAFPSSRTCCSPTRGARCRLRARNAPRPEVRRWLDAAALDIERRDLRRRVVDDPAGLDRPGPQAHRAQGAAGHDLEGRLRQRRLTAHIYPDAARRWRLARGRPAALRLLLRLGAGAEAVLRPHRCRRPDHRCSPASSTPRSAASARPTATGASPRRSAGPPADILFLSDVVEELDAAREAGLRTVLVDRREDYPAPRRASAAGPAGGTAGRPIRPPARRHPARPPPAQPRPLPRRPSARSHVRRNPATAWCSCPQAAPTRAARPARPAEAGRTRVHAGSSWHGPGGRLARAGARGPATCRGRSRLPARPVRARARKSRPWSTTASGCD
jgi:1,2-dihydroxy-3-keto-5-methylthiopentene dioxygenase